MQIIQFVMIPPKLLNYACSKMGAVNAFASDGTKLLDNWGKNWKI